MWVKLGTEYLNLDHVFRVRINKGFRNGKDEWAAELETVDPKGQLGIITRVRGAEAELLQTLLAERCAQVPLETVDTDTPVPAHALRNTVADLNLP